jgi:heptosyltransferase I
MFGLPQVVGPEGPALLDPERPRTVCIVLLSGVGDVVAGLPLAADVKGVHPHNRVVWVAQPAPAQVARHHPHVDRVVEFDVVAGPSGLRNVAALRDRMRDVRADVTLNVQRYLKSLWPTLFSAAPLRVGLPRSKTRDGIFLAHTHTLADGPWKHTQDLFLDFRWALGVPRDADVTWSVTFSDRERSDQARFFARTGKRPRVGLVLASSVQAKDWPPSRYAALCDALVAERGLDVLLLGGPSARERAAAKLVLGTTSHPPTDCTGDGVRRLMWLVDGCDLIVAPDTGALHVAHALGVPVVGLYGHTNPWRVGPYARFRDLVVDRYTDPGDPPDARRYAPKPGRMETITISDVLEKVDVALVRYVDGGREG